MKASTKKIIKEYSIKTIARALNLDAQGYTYEQISTGLINDRDYKKGLAMVEAAKDFFNCKGESMIYKRFDMESPVHLVSLGHRFEFIQMVEGSYKEYHQVTEDKSGYFGSKHGYQLGSKSFKGYTKAEAIESLLK